MTAAVFVWTVTDVIRAIVIGVMFVILAVVWVADRWGK